jgi:hypothetical protein
MLETYEGGSPWTRRGSEYPGMRIFGNDENQNGNWVWAMSD